MQFLPPSAGKIYLLICKKALAKPFTFTFNQHTKRKSYSFKYFQEKVGVFNRDLLDSSIV